MRKRSLKKERKEHEKREKENKEENRKRWDGGQAEYVHMSSMSIKSTCASLIHVQEHNSSF